MKFPELASVMRLQLKLVGEVFRRESRVYSADIVGLVGVGVTIGTVNAAEGQTFRNAPDPEQSDRGEHGCERGVRIGAVEIPAVFEAAEHAGRVALASLLLNAQTIVVLTEKETMRWIVVLSVGLNRSDPRTAYMSRPPMSELSKRLSLNPSRFR